MLSQDSLTVLLQKRFGFQSFREGQLEAILILMEQERLLCIQPTGHGKSLLYQLPSLLLDGITLVISPLLALMRDQMGQLEQRFNIKAAAMNSDQTDKENVVSQEQAKQGLLKILFLAPEQLDNLIQFNFLLTLPLSLIVVDEAHCISTWGHDFRPSYRQIVKLIHGIEKKNSQLKVLGLTATANSKTENDIKLQLSSNDKKVQVYRASLDRPNIQLAVSRAEGYTEKLLMLEELMKDLKGEGLIYCATRENTELVATFLQRQGVNSIAYNAGFASGVKRKLQQEFTEGKYKVIAATNALGMGIDKANLRFIIHFDIPGSITAYYQEVGRAGRDGLLAQGILLFDVADKRIQEYFLRSSNPTGEDFRIILQAIKEAKFLPKITEIKRLVNLHPTLVTVVVAELVEQGFLEKTVKNGVQVYSIINKQEEPHLERHLNQQQVKSSELDAMLHYATQINQCRMTILREALGDGEAKDCGHCDVCNKMQPRILSSKAISEIQDWLDTRVVTTKDIVQYKVVSGISIFDGKLRAPLFIKFMQERTQKTEILPELLIIIKKTLGILLQQYHFGCVVPIPSRTWCSRNKIAEFIADHLQITVLDCLYWHDIPKARQGELFNNDQRRFNVNKKMAAILPKNISDGDILLLDDYIGSGATLKEAARVLRNIVKTKQIIVPFTLATIMWRLGRPGMI